MISVGVIGYGYWGPNAVRNFADSEDARVSMICDLSASRLSLAKRRHPQAEITSDFREIIEGSKTDAIVVATPVSTHFDLALAALRAGKHVLVEKPITATVEQAEQLVEEADRRGLTLMVDHTYIYTGAVQKIGALIKDGSLGDILYYDSVRVNLGLLQHDVNVIWDLAVHDLSIVAFLLPEPPLAISAIGMRHVAGMSESVAYLTLFFSTNTIAHINVNWLAPVKVRSTLIGGTNKMLVFNDLDPSEKIRVYDKGVDIADNPDDVAKLRIGYRSGDMWAPQYDTTEALRGVASDFINSIKTGASPLTDGVMGLRIIKQLAAADESLRRRGIPVEIK